MAAISLVQQKSGTGTSLSFTAPTTAGNCVIGGWTDEAGATGVSAVKLGGSAGNFAQLVAASGNPSGKGILLASLWADPNCAGGQTAIAVTPTGTAAAPTIWIAEFSGIAASLPLDGTSAATGKVAAWSSGSTATTAGAELWVGVLCNGGASPAGPASPWTNFSVSDGSGDSMLYGYNIVSTTGAAAYSGTGGSTSPGWAAAIATLKGPAPRMPPVMTVPPWPVIRASHY